ncbi:hypothetical protein JVT61DRAFT_6379 [Boletus reticuloceps]|uniref:Uncharacterized protein n=1 Tax=Boletus reticuloceps TaxID=495285 RepID=A0A8I2YKA0_9AGAM|nr:hypothetical protein JVT61DRAFT_6379 [Boletus reticuloceps]
MRYIIPDTHLRRPVACGPATLSILEGEPYSTKLVLSTLPTHSPKPRNRNGF